MVNSLQYWDFKTNAQIKQISKEKCSEAISNIENKLYELINAFDNPERPYITNPTINKQSGYENYEHLSRLAEWTVKENAKDNSLGEDDD